MDWFVVSIKTDSLGTVKEQLEQYADNPSDVNVDVDSSLVAVRRDIQPTLGGGGVNWKKDAERIIESVESVGEIGVIMYLNDTTESSEAHVYELDGAATHVDTFTAEETNEWDSDTASEVESNYGFRPLVR